MPLLGIRVFADVIKVRNLSLSWTRVNPRSNHVYPHKRQKRRGTDTGEMST